MSFLSTRLTAATILGLAAFSNAQGPPPPPPPPLLPPPVPAGNPVTPQKTNLGKVLFWDEQMSTSGTVACATCHRFDGGGSDPRSGLAHPGSRHPGFDGQFNTPDDVFGSPGTSRIRPDGSYQLDLIFRLAPQVTSRKAPSVFNAAYATSLFWDGRADPTCEDPVTGNVLVANGAALESQAVAPPVSDVEMGHVGGDWTAVATRLATATPLRLASQVPAQMTTYIAGRTYPELFQEAFGTPDVTPARILLAIATYERALFTNQAPIDQFVAGQPPPLTQQELQGQQIFNTIGRCNVCHAGPRFTNDSFRYIGVRPQIEDLGRFNVTGNNGDRGRMKVPTLRNVELRAPYFHNGSMATLEDVVDFYDRGGDFVAPNLDPAIAPIGLSAAQKAALVAFLRRPLTDPRVVAQTAPFDHPILYTQTTRVPAHFGTGTSGSGGFTPSLVALDPPVVGNGRFAVGIDRALGGAPAFLIVSGTNDPVGTILFGATLHVPLVGGSIVRISSLPGAGAGNGNGSVVLGVPNNPLLVGTSASLQWLVLDLTPGKRLSATDAATFTYF